MVQKTIENAAHILEQVIYLVTVCRLGIRVGAQGAGTHHEKEKCQESPHDSQEHRVLHATWCDGRPRTWHCRDQAQQSVSSQKGLKRLTILSHTVCSSYYDWITKVCHFILTFTYECTVQTRLL